MQIQTRFILCLFLCFTVWGESLWAQQRKEASSREKLTGNWDGVRDDLRQVGINLQSTFVGEVMANVSGGIQKKAVFVENWDLRLDLDIQRFLNWKGGRLHASIMQNNGGLPSRYIGDLQTASNIQATETVKLYEAWLQQNLLDNYLSLLAGVYDINFEFDYMESAALFLNSSQGLGGAFAASGLVGPSTFPATAPSARIKFMPDPSWYAQVAITDGAPGVSHVDWRLQHEDDGSLWIAEAGFLVASKGESNSRSKQVQDHYHISRAFTSNYLFKIAIGFWSYSRNFTDVRFGANIPVEKNEQGGYLLVDARSLRWLHDKLKPISWHFRVGLADNEISRFHYYIGSGLTYRGLISADPHGKMGISISAVESSNIYKQHGAGQSMAPEVALEWTYKTSLTNWLSLQPDVQYILNPGAKKSTKPAFVVGLRSNIDL